MLDATPFATTVTGQILIPAIGIMLAASIIGGFGAVVKLFHRLDQQDAISVTIQNEVRTNGGTSLKDAVLRQGMKLDAHLESSRYQQERLDHVVEEVARLSAKQ